MLPQAIVPDSTGIRVHKAGEFVGGAVDIYAPPGSEVLAPAPGVVVDAMPSPAVPGSWQIRGGMVRPDGREVPFVIAHFIEDGHPRAGDTFRKGDVLGWIKIWAAAPRSTHAHVAFRRAGDSKLPPPGNVLVERAFERFGPMRERG
jgi:hypothetical protein